MTDGNQNIETKPRMYLVWRVGSDNAFTEVEANSSFQARKIEAKRRRVSYEDLCARLKD